MIFPFITWALLCIALVWTLLALAGIKPFGTRTRLAVFVFVLLWVLNSLVGGLWNVATRPEPRTVDWINAAIGLLGCIAYSHFAVNEFIRWMEERDKKNL